MHRSSTAAAAAAVQEGRVHRLHGVGGMGGEGCGLELGLKWRVGHGQLPRDPIARAGGEGV